MPSNPYIKKKDTAFYYVGEELDLFSHAVNWKCYWASKLSPYIGANILEVGAGNGTNTVLLASERQNRWVCLEPDANLVTQLQAKIDRLKCRPANLEIMVGDITSLQAESKFDTILYIDVLEHIEAQNEEMERAFQLLAPGGHLIVLSPAHQFLYSPFDRSIGHFRRYSRCTLRAAGPSERPPARLFYLDSVGFVASLANRLFLKQTLPTLAQIRFWDRYLVLSSSIIDPIIGFNFGKTVIGIWRKPID